MLKQILENLKNGKELVLDWYENAFSKAVDTALLFNGGVWELKILHCISASSQGLGTCGCNSHPTYVYEEISRGEALKLIKEYIERAEQHQREKEEELKFLYSMIESLT